MTTEVTTTYAEWRYGYGWMTRDHAIGHGGHYKTDMLMDPTTGALAIMLVQHTGEWGAGEPDPWSAFFGPSGLA